MKVLLLADVNSIHTVKWARGLWDAGLQISIFSLASCKFNSYYDLYKGIRIISPKERKKSFDLVRSFLSKASYLLSLPLLLRTIRELRPDIVHAHYASSYGILGALCNFHPYVLSVWGTDIFEFPRKTALHRWIIRQNLSRADRILSTSVVMAKEVRNYSRKDVVVTPFGVDLEVFRPNESISLFTKNDIIIGTIKSLEAVYGVEYLIKAFKIVKCKYPTLPLKLLIVGAGSQEKYLKNITKALSISNDTVFTGYVSHDEVQIYHNMITIFGALSNQESFGASVIEASACGKPVVVSNVGGLAEAVENNVTGFVVPPRDAVKAADALEKLVLDRSLRAKMGAAGRARVEYFYNWEDNLDKMIGLYQEIMNVGITSD